MPSYFNKFPKIYYDAAGHGNYKLVTNLLRRVQIKEGLRENMSLFDFGCGSGRLALALKKNNFKCNYSGQDIVPELINYLKLKVPNANVICAKERKILMPDESQDIVVNFSVFTHLLLEEIFIYMKDIFRVLKPGGSHIFSYHEFDLNPFPEEPKKVYIRNKCHISEKSAGSRARYFKPSVNRQPEFRARDS